MNEQAVKYNGRSFSIVLLLIIGVLAILLWWKSCGGSHGVDPKIAEMQRQNDSMINRLAYDVKVIHDSLKDVQGEKELADSMLSDAAKDLKKMFAQNEKLKAEHDKEPAPIPISDSEDIVTDKYVKNCDQCFASLIRMEDSVKAAKKIVDKLGEIHQKQLNLKDDEIGLYRLSMDRQRSSYNTLLDKYAKLRKGKASLSGGILYQYSPAVSNIGAYLTFRTRKFHEFGIQGGGNTLSSWFIGFHAGAKIF